jgi:hypothetical protein
VEGVPDLAFLRRRGLAWSFTGEKLTGAQLEEVFTRLREDFKVGAEVALSCVPTDPGGGWLPGYVLVLAYTGDAPADPPDLTGIFDLLLGQINTEYGDKRASGRLAPPRQEWFPYDGLAAALDPRAGEEGGETQRAWDSQFKLLPLLRRTWEDLNLSH